MVSTLPCIAGQFYDVRFEITGKMVGIYLGEGWLLYHRLRSKEMFLERIFGLLYQPREH
jgi:hypothetical protein